MSGNEVLDGLVKRLASAHPTVAIIGMGYVGLPLAVELGETGARVIGLDVSEELAAQLNEGRSHIGDIPDERVAALTSAPEEGGSLRVTTDQARLAEADAVIICVPTPLRKSKDPDISYIVAASEALARVARPGQLVVLESTTYPGTTEEILVPMLSERGLEPGRDIAVAFSPERVDPGNERYGLTNTPKVVGGVTESCRIAARSLYKRFADSVVEVSSPAAAEMVKLLENTFRSVNIGLVNEFALICHRLGLDVWEIVDAAATKPFGFMPFKPGPGLGGHCIPVDPHYLAWKLRSLNFTARFIELADAVNSRMPEHVVGVVADALNESSMALRGSSVFVLGVTYKPDVADVRESPALTLISLLLAKGAKVEFHDPLIASVEVGERTLERKELDAATLQTADCVLLATDHACYDPDFLTREARLLVDTRNATASVLAKSPELRKKIRRI